MITTVAKSRESGDPQGATNDIPDHTPEMDNYIKYSSAEAKEAFTE
jgi:hypothetical protein